MTSAIFEGLWVDHTLSPFLRWTLTLNLRYGTLLLATQTLLVNWAGSSCWSILAFTLHQLRAGQVPTDGLDAQINLLLRNHPGHVATVWALILLARTWRGRAIKAYSRCFKVAIIPLLIAAIFATLSLFAAKTASTALNLNSYLLQDLGCGVVVGSGLSFESAQAQANVIATGSRAAAVIVDARSSGSTQKAVGLPTQQIGFTELTVPCQIPGQDRCLSEPQQLTSDPINSNKDLGVDNDNEAQVVVRFRQTCSPVSVDDVTRKVPDRSVISNSSWLYLINLGPTVADEDFTFVYGDRLINDTLPYAITSVAYTQDSAVNQTWMPSSTFNIPFADVNAHLIEMNSVRTLHPVQDPVYLATGKHMSSTSQGYPVYLPDEPFHVVICTEQVDWLNPVNNASTGFLGYTQAWNKAQELGFKAAQLATASRIYLASLFAKNYAVVTGQGANSLLATKALNGLFVSSIPSDQSQRDFRRWFQTSLLVLLAHMADYPVNTGYSPDSPDTAALLFTPASAFNGSIGAELVKQCKTQRVQSVGEVINFYFSAVLVVIVPCLMIMIIGLALPAAVHSLPQYRLAIEPDNDTVDRRARRPRAAGSLSHRTIAYVADHFNTLHRATVGGLGWQAADTTAPYRDELREDLERIPRPIHKGRTIRYPYSAELAQMESRRDSGYHQASLDPPHTQASASSSGTRIAGPAA